MLKNLGYYDYIFVRCFCHFHVSYSIFLHLLDFFLLEFEYKVCVCVWDSSDLGQLQIFSFVKPCSISSDWTCQQHKRKEASCDPEYDAACGSESFHSNRMDCRWCESMAEFEKSAHFRLIFFKIVLKQNRVHLSNAVATFHHKGSADILTNRKTTLKICIDNNY